MNTEDLFTPKREIPNTLEWKIDKIGKQMLWYTMERYKLKENDFFLDYFELPTYFDGIESIQLKCKTNYSTFAIIVYVSDSGNGFSFYNPKENKGKYITYYDDIELEKIGIFKTLGISEETILKKPIKITQITEKIKYYKKNQMPQQALKNFYFI